VVPLLVVPLLVVPLLVVPLLVVPLLVVPLLVVPALLWWGLPGQQAAVPHAPLQAQAQPLLRAQAVVEEAAQAYVPLRLLSERACSH
jgi:hypothetical protein